jgi:arginyl-tRNA synthetase
MKFNFDCSENLEALLVETARSLDEFEGGFEPQIRQADERFGDFQANGVLPRAKKIGKNPREMAQRIIDSLPATEDWEVSLAGPGFINFKLSPDFLLRWVRAFDQPEKIAVSALGQEPKKIVIDFSSPNTAKQMHVGHIRSTIIGESLARLMIFCGHKVIRDNHLGDWGTQFGILLYAIKRENVSLDQLGEDPIAELENLYRKGTAWTKEDESSLEKARKELVELQAGNPENLELWKKIKEISMDSFDAIYEMLGVRFDFAHGESFYRDRVNQVYDSLLEHEICEENEGALVVFHPEHKRFAKQPFIIRKKDGASNYATTDLATLSYRQEEWEAEQIIYVTDGRQRDHFEQLFLTSRKWFKAEKRAIPELSHVWFGTILGEDNKAIKTRDGQPVKLADLLNEAIERASRMVIEKNPELTEDEVTRRAKVIGLGAVKYADLSQDRTLDYAFSWEKLLAMQGNTAPYLQYAVARISSIFRKMADGTTSTIEEARPPQTPHERTLARKLLFFPLALSQTRRELKPHFLCTYLYELATDFSSFYNHDKVMVEDRPTQGLRILLCLRTKTFLCAGLEILGIETLEKM